MTGGFICVKEKKAKFIVRDIKILLHYKLSITTQVRDVGDTLESSLWT